MNLHNVLEAEEVMQTTKASATEQNNSPRITHPCSNVSSPPTGLTKASICFDLKMGWHKPV